MRESEKQGVVKRRRSCSGRVLIFLATLLAALPLLLCGCGKIVFTTGLNLQELFTVGDKVGTIGELTVYLVTMQNQYTEAYGEDVFSWEGNESVGETLKENALERLVKVKVLNLMAEEEGVALDETEESRVRVAAAAYLESLSEADLAYLDITEDDVTDMYMEYDLALKMADRLVEDVNTEVSDDDARTVTVQSILIKTYSIDEDGNRVEFSQTQKAEAKERAQAIRDEIQYGMDNLLGITFNSYIAEYNEDSVSTYTFGKDEVDSAFEEAAFNQQIGTISDVVETQDGYRIIKAISVSDTAEIEANKEKIRQDRLESAYLEAYNAYVEDIDVNLNAQRWAAITLCEDSSVTTSNFFEIYNEYVGG